jgi:hypothetical protein
MLERGRGGGEFAWRRFWLKSPLNGHFVTAPQNLTLLNRNPEQTQGPFLESMRPHPINNTLISDIVEGLKKYQQRLVGIGMEQCIALEKATLERNSKKRKIEYSSISYK